MQAVAAAAAAAAGGAPPRLGPFGGPPRRPSEQELQHSLEAQQQMGQRLPDDYMAAAMRSAAGQAAAGAQGQRDAGRGRKGNITRCSSVWTRIVGFRGIQSWASEEAKLTQKPNEAQRSRVLCAKSGFYMLHAARLNFRSKCVTGRARLSILPLLECSTVCPSHPYVWTSSSGRCCSS